MSIRPIRIPGRKPAINIRAALTSVAAAYTSITIEGGIRIPSVPAFPITPAAKDSGYPAFTIPTITIDPMAATVAGDEPDTAAKIIQAITEAIAMPPWM
jgi:hypothetical protein